MIFGASAPGGAPIIQHAQAILRGDSAVWDKLIDTGGDLLVNLVGAVVIMVATIWLATWAGRLSRRALTRFHSRRAGAADPTLAIFASSLARNAVFILGGIAVLTQLGVKTTSIIAAIGAASLAIGLAMQGALSNVAAGVMIFLFRPYRVGDIVDLSGRIGVVRALDLFVTELATLDNLKVVVPNGKVFGDVIVNHSFHPQRRADVSFHLPIAADSGAVMDRLRDWLEDDPRVLRQPPPLIEVTSMTEAFVEVAVRPWAAREDYAPVKADILLRARILETDPEAELPPPPRERKPPALSPLEMESLL